MKIALLLSAVIFVLGFTHHSDLTSPIPMSKPNNNLVIREELDLHGEMLVLPPDTKVDFKKGGSISNGTIIFHDATLKGNPAIHCKLGGTLKNEDLHVDWFLTGNDLDELISNNFYSIVSGHNVIYSKKEYVTEGPLMYNKHPLTIKNTKFIGNGATLMMTDTVTAKGSFFYFEKSENVEVRDFILDGGISLNAKTPEGGRHNITIKRSKDICLYNIVSRNAFTDGIVILDCKGILIDSCLIENSGRNALSLVSGTGIRLNNTIFRHSFRNAPMMGIDIEPNNAPESEIGVIIEGCTFSDNLSAGIGINLSNQAGKEEIGKNKSIIINDCLFDNNLLQIMVSANKNTGHGNIEVTNCQMKNSGFASVDVICYSSENTPKLIFSDLNIHNSNLRNGKDYREHKSAFVVHNVKRKPNNGPIGNISLKNITIKQDPEFKANIDRGVLFYDNSLYGGIMNVELDNIDVDLSRPESKSVMKVNVKAVDKKELKFKEYVFP